MFTTHDRYFLDHLASRVVELDQGKAYLHEGNYSSYLENKAIRQTIADQGPLLRVTSTDITACRCVSKTKR